MLKAIVLAAGYISLFYLLAEDSTKMEFFNYPLKCDMNLATMESLSPGELSSVFCMLKLQNSIITYIVYRFGNY